MTRRRSFFAALFAPLLAPILKRFAPKPVIQAKFVPMQVFCELPEPIEDLTVAANKLYAFTKSGMYEVFGDGSYIRIDPPFLSIVKIPDPLPWETDGAGLMPVVEMTKAEFRGRYPA